MNAALPSLPPASAVSRLTPAELRTVTLLVEGLERKDIARRIGRSRRTVERQLDDAYTKLGISNRVLLTRWAVACGLVPAVPRDRFTS